MRFALPSLLVLMLAASASAQSPVVGDWSGTIEGAGIVTVFHITETDGTLAATFDVPAQGAKDIPAGTTALDGQTLTVSIPAAGIVYRGVLDGDVLTGEWEQAGGAYPLVLRRLAEGEATEAPESASAPVRDDEPQGPFPYREEEMSVASVEGVILAGTLTVPDGDGPFPAVVLVSGSGPQNRDSEVFGHRLFRVLSDHLARRGIAVLRYDDRGTAESTGDFGSATTADFALDAEAAARALALRPETASVGLVGHSEGGTIGPMVANAGVLDYVVSLAGTSIRGSDILAYQLSRGADMVNASPESVTAARAGIAAFLTEASTGDDATAIARATAALQRETADIPPADRAALNLDGMNSEGLIQYASTPWERFFVGYDPSPALEALQIPVLAVFAARDQQVRASDNVPAAVEALAGAADGSAVVVLPNLNHLFQPTETGSVAEYATINTSYDPGAMDLVADWILRQAPRTP